MITRNTYAAIAAGLFFITSTSYASDDDRYTSSDRDNALVCPQATQDAIDVEFGVAVDGTATSAMTQCLAVRGCIRAAVNVSSNALNGKSNANQQINNVKNMVENYEKVYGLTLGKDGYRIVVLVHGAAGKFLLDGPVYDAKFGTSGGNDPTIGIVKGLIEKGVKVFMCQNTMRANGWKTADLIPGVLEVPGGVTASIDYGMRGWVVLTP